MKFARYIIALLLVLFSMAAMAGSGNRNPVLRLAKNVMGLIDTLAVRGIDRDYIDVPKRPWQVTIRGNTNWATLKMSSTIDASSRFLDFVGDYPDPLNADMILQMDDIGRIRQWQVSIGAGYAYNFVPVRGVLINVNVMPMLTCLNRMKVYRYDSTYRQMAEDGLEHSYEEMEDLLYDTMDDPSVMQLKADPQNPEVTETGRMTLNFNARASLTCNLAEWAYVNVYGQLYNFRFRQAANHGSLTEWFVKAALGIRS